MKRRALDSGFLSLLLAGTLSCGAPETTSPDLARPLSADAAREQARAALAIAHPLDRSLEFAKVLEGAGLDAQAGLREELDAAPIDIGETERVHYAMWWARLEPEAAFEATATHPDTTISVIVGLMRAWAFEDPKGAYAAIARVPGTLQDAAVHGVVYGWSESGKPGLVEQIRGIPDGPTRQKTSEALARRLVLEGDLDETLAWLKTQPRDFRAILGQRIASEAAKQGDGAMIAKWATPLVSSGEESISGLPRRIGTRWAARDPDAAFAWLKSLPEGKDRDDGVMESYRDWARRDPTAASVWLNRMKLERWIEPAYSIHARQISGQNPREALDLVARFTDPDLNNRITVLIFERWVAKDLDATHAWYREVKDSLSDFIRKRVEPRIERDLEMRASGRLVP